MLGTYNDWMLSLPAILQVLVALATLTVIGLTPMLLWLGYRRGLDAGCVARQPGPPEAGRCFASGAGTQRPVNEKCM